MRLSKTRRMSLTPHILQSCTHPRAEQEPTYSKLRTDGMSSRYLYERVKRIRYAMMTRARNRLFNSLEINNYLNLPVRCRIESTSDRNRNKTRAIRVQTRQLLTILHSFSFCPDIAERVFNTWRKLYVFCGDLCGNYLHFVAIWSGDSRKWLTVTKCWISRAIEYLVQRH